MFTLMKPFHLVCLSVCLCTDVGHVMASQTSQVRRWDKNEGWVRRWVWSRVIVYWLLLSHHGVRTRWASQAFEAKFRSSQTKQLRRHVTHWGQNRLPLPLRSLRRERSGHKMEWLATFIGVNTVYRFTVTSLMLSNVVADKMVSSVIYLGLLPLVD